MRRVILDGAACAEPAAAMAALEKALALPDWWGRNLDALHDCLWECGEVFLVVKNPGALRSTPLGGPCGRCLPIPPRKTPGCGWPRPGVSGCARREAAVRGAGDGAHSPVEPKGICF